MTIITDGDRYFSIDELIRILKNVKKNGDNAVKISYRFEGYNQYSYLESFKKENRK